MVNIAARIVGTLLQQLHFEVRYWHITQAENATFYISVKYYKVVIILLDLIPLKNASDKYFLTLNQLSFNTQQVSSVSEFFRFSNVRQMTWISNHTLMILERRLPTKFGLLKFVNFSAQNSWIYQYQKLAIGLICN